MSRSDLFIVPRRNYERFPMQPFKKLNNSGNYTNIPLTAVCLLEMDDEIVISCRMALLVLTRKISQHKEGVN